MGKGSTLFYSLLIVMGGIFFFYMVRNEVVAADIQYKKEMVLLIEEISNYAKEKNPYFQVIGNGGLDLYRQENLDDALTKRLLTHVDGVLVEGRAYTWGKTEEDQAMHTMPTTPDVKGFIDSSLSLPVANHLPVFIVDYCQDHTQIDDAYRENRAKGYIPLTGSPELNTIPSYPKDLPGKIDKKISRLDQVHSFLILLNPGNFKSKEEYLRKLRNTNYDLLIIDRYFDNQPLSSADVASLRVKKNGTSRLVFAYLSIGEAENYRPYWQASWSISPPSWIAEENPDWQGNFKVKYWTKEWKKVLFGSPRTLLDEIVKDDFNGVFLDVIDAYDYFENKQVM